MHFGKHKTTKFGDSRFKHIRINCCGNLRDNAILKRVACSENTLFSLLSTLTCRMVWASRAVLILFFYSVLLVSASQMSSVSQWKCSPRCAQVFSTAGGCNYHRKSCTLYQGYLASSSRTLEHSRNTWHAPDGAYERLKRRKLTHSSSVVSTFILFTYY